MKLLSQITHEKFRRKPKIINRNQKIKDGNQNILKETKKKNKKIKK